MKLDANKEIRRAVDTGKVAFGFKETENSLITGKSKMIVLATNIEKPKKEKLSEYAKMIKVPAICFEGNSKEFGSVCGKPFVISTMSVMDEGKSKILELAKNETKSKAAKEK